MDKSHQLHLINSTMRLTLLLLTIIASAQSWHIYYKNNCEDNVSVSKFHLVPFPMRSKQSLLSIIKHSFKRLLQAIQLAFSDPARVISLHLEPEETMTSFQFDNETVTVMADAGLTAHFRRERIITTRYHLDNRNAYSASEMSLEIRPRG